VRTRVSAPFNAGFLVSGIVPGHDRAWPDD
jgi:hypothetical protein